MNANTTTRRAALAGTASLPALALALSAAAEMDDPAIAAVRRWIEAIEAESGYTTPDGTDWEDDPHTAELEAAIETRLGELVKTPPTTATGLALTLAAFTFAEHGEGIGMRFDRPDVRWGDFRRDGGRDLVAAVWSSPAAAETVAKLGRTGLGDRMSAVPFSVLTALLIAEAKQRVGLPYYCRGGRPSPV